MEKSWNNISIASDPHLVLGARKGRGGIETKSVPVGAGLFEKLRERATETLESLSDRTAREYQPTASLDGKIEYFQLPLSDIPNKPKIYSGRKTDEKFVAVLRENVEGADIEVREKTNPDRTAALLQSLKSIQTIPQLNANKIPDFKSIFYSVSFQQEDQGWVHFIKKSSPFSVFQPGRLFARYRTTLEPVETPDLLVYQDFDIVIGRTAIAAFGAYPLQVLFTDVSLMMSAVPSYVSRISDSISEETPLTPRAISALEEVGGKTVSMASRIYRLAERLSELSMNRSEISRIFEIHEIDPGDIFTPGGEFDFDEKNVPVFLDVIEGRYFKDDWTGEARRADKYSKR